MPVIILCEEKRDVQIKLNLTASQAAQLAAAAKQRYPLTVSQLAYQYFMCGLAAEKRSRSREVFRIVENRKDGRP